MHGNLAWMVQEAETYALALISRQCNILPFHNGDHTRRVVTRIEALVEAADLPEHERNLAKIAGWFHDVVWHSRILTSPNGMQQRQSLSGQNEEASAKQLGYWIGNQTTRVPPQEEQWMAEAILATVMDEQTFLQTNLTPDTHAIGRCLALADAGAPGMDDMRSLQQEIDRLFQERNISIFMSIQEGKIPAPLQADYHKAMIAWLHRTIAYATVRRDQLETDLGNLSKAQKKRIRPLFRHFGNNITGLHRLIEFREDLDFWQTAKDMGYPIT